MPSHMPVYCIVSRKRFDYTITYLCVCRGTWPSGSSRPSTRSIAYNSTMHYVMVVEMTDSVLFHAESFHSWLSL